MQARGGRGSASWLWCSTVATPPRRWPEPTTCSPFRTQSAFRSLRHWGPSTLTAYAALRWKARVEPSDTLLVLGAGSGVGLAAVGIGKALGARVIAAASSQAKLAAAQAQGADEMVDYAAGLHPDRILALTGGAGVDIVVDPVGGAVHEAALASLAWDGRYLILGFAAGGIPQVAANRLLVKNRSALGFVLMFYRQRRPELLRQSWDELMAMLADGRLRPATPVPLPLGHGPEALRALMDRSVTGPHRARSSPLGPTSCVNHHCPASASSTCPPSSRPR